MQQNQQSTERTEVETTKIVPGPVKIGFGQIRNPTPAIFKRISGAIRKFCAGISTLVLSAPAKVVDAADTTVICWWLGVIVLASYTLDGLLGVETPEDEKK